LDLVKFILEQRLNQKTKQLPMKKMLLTMLPLCLLLVSAMAQERVVTGKVTAAEDSSPVPGVNVVVQGTTKGTTTDIDGNYSLSLGQGENALVFTFVGFKTQTIDVTNRTVLDVSMESDVTALNEVVVVGYGEQRKVEITGSVANVEGATINRQPNVNPISSLQGRVAGVQITNSGSPGSSPQIKIRGLGTVYGSTNPLYIVDGVWYDDISFLNPADVDNISILKDASAQSIYGVRAANGVVLISTKKGSKEGNFSVSYNGFVGNQVVTNLVEMANGPQYAEMINELDQINYDVSGSTDPFVPRYADPSSYGTTEWHRQILRNAFIQNHNLSITGGTEKANHSFSLGYVDQEGVVEQNDYRRYTGRLQSEFRPFEIFKIGYSATAALGKSNDIPGGIFHELFSASPITPVYYSDGAYGDPNDYRAGGSNLFNPQATLDFFDQSSRNYRVTGNIFAELTLFKSLTFRTSLGGDWGQNEVNKFDPIYVATFSQRNTISRLTLTEDVTRNWIFENTLTYSKDVADHSFKLLVGQGAQSYRFNKRILTALNVEKQDEYHFLDLGTDVTVDDIDTGFPPAYPLYNTLASYFARLNYSFQDRYLLTLSYRADGSSKFSGSNRWGYFPSVGVGWVISEEGFMQDQTIFDNLKIRGSWGKIGNMSVPANLSILTVSRGLEYTYVGGDGSTAPGGAVDRFVPPTTFWEKGVGTNIGLEGVVMDNKLNFEFDYYIRDTQDAIFDAPILGSGGAASDVIIANQATFRNSGFEIALGWNDQKSSDFGYSVSANVSINKNEVLEVASGKNPIRKAVGTTGGALNTRTILGQPIGHFYGYKVLGIFQDQSDIDDHLSDEGDILQPNAQPGDFKYDDTNGDGVIDQKDYIILGNPNPRVLYGISTNFRYKNFDLGLDFQGVAGVEIYNATLAARFGSENFTKEFYENRWHGPGTSNEYPSAYIGGGQNYLPNSFYVEKGDYFRVRNAQLGYTFPASMTGKWKISNLRIYLNAQNPINIFKYRGFTPEIGGGPTVAGVDQNVYPLSATYNFGVNLTF
jgi:TonB-linked SusC/RagA family outer membrane protein